MTKYVTGITLYPICWYDRWEAEHQRHALYNEYTWMSEKFCNIFVCASLWHVYHMTKAVQVMLGT